MSTPFTSGWRLLGWFGLVLSIMGLGDIVLAWFPLHFGNPQWEFGTVATTFAGLPLLSLGYAGMLASGIGQGKRWLVGVVSCVLVLSVLALLGQGILFLTDVPLALRASGAGPSAMAIRKAIVKTTLLGVGFTTIYAVCAFSGLRFVRKSSH